VGTIIRNKLYLFGGGNYDKGLKRYLKMYCEVWTLDLSSWRWEEQHFSGTPPNVCDFLNIFTVNNHFYIEGGWYTNPWCYDTVTRTWTTLKVNEEGKYNNNDSSVALIDNRLIFYGGYFNIYRHHLVAVDLSPLMFSFQ